MSLDLTYYPDTLYRFWPNNDILQSEVYLVRKDDRFSPLGLCIWVGDIQEQLEHWLRRRSFVKIEAISWVSRKDLSEGDLIRGYGFDCMDTSPRRAYRLGHGGLAVSCSHGHHCVDGQLENGVYIGIEKL